MRHLQASHLCTLFFILKHLHLKHKKKFSSQSPVQHLCPVYSVAMTTWTWSCKDNAVRFLTVWVWGLISLVIETAVNIQNIAVSHCLRKHCWIRPKRAFGMSWMDTNKALSILRHYVFGAGSVPMSCDLRKEKAWLYSAFNWMPFPSLQCQEEESRWAAPAQRPDAAPFYPELSHTGPYILL